MSFHFYGECKQQWVKVYKLEARGEIWIVVAFLSFDATKESIRDGYNFSSSSSTLLDNMMVLYCRLAPGCELSAVCEVNNNVVIVLRCSLRCRCPHPVRNNIMMDRLSTVHYFPVIFLFFSNSLSRSITVVRSLFLLSNPNFHTDKQCYFINYALYL